MRDTFGKVAAIAAILLLIGTVYAFAPARMTTSSPTADPLFAGAYYALNRTLVIPVGNQSSPLTTFIVGGVTFDLAYTNVPGSTWVIGTVSDSTGFSFAAWMGSAGSFNLSNGLTTWGAPDGNAAVAVTSWNQSSATVEIQGRVTPWSVQFEGGPQGAPCDGTGSPTLFGEAVWTARSGDCGALDGGYTEWNVTPADGVTQSFGLSGISLSACQELVWQGLYPPSIFSSVDCFGWFDSSALYGFVLGPQGSVMLAMSPSGE